MSDRKKNRESQNRNQGRPNNGPYQSGPYNGPYQNGPYNGPNNGYQNGPYNGPNNGQYQNGPYNGPNNGYQNGPYNGPGNGPYNNGQYQQNGPYNGQYQNGAYQNGHYNGQGNGAPKGRKSKNANGAPAGGYPGGKDNRKSSKRKTRRRVVFVIEILVLLLLAVGLFVAAKFSKLKTEKIAEGDIIINSEIPSEQAAVMKGYRNIALFGVDSRDASTTDSRSDTIMIASINNETKDIKLVSIYRDTYLDNTNGEYRKATECYQFGGPKRSMNMINKNLDMDITDYVTVNFNAVAEVVNALGGVEIDIQEDEIVHLNNYQVEGSEVTGLEIVPVESTGLQTLNGLQALSYCRIRYTTGDDFKRTERQRTVLEQIFKKAKTANLIKLNNIIDSVFDNISTSLSITEMASLAKDIASYNMSDTTGFPFEQMPANIAAGDCVVPVNLAQNVKELHTYLFGSDGYTPSNTVQEISNKIINETGIQ